ncbi:MAG: tetratricopeptide repeat protein [Roseivirga sp.]|nr:tetratricopeptide repeat protein [Roseivirga sp.]
MALSSDFYATNKAKLILICIPFLVYCWTFGYDYTVDDLGVIGEHSHVLAGVDGLGEIFTTNYRNGINNFNDGLYRPLSLAVFAIFEEIAPGSPVPGHILNVLVYCLLVLSIFSLIKALPVEQSEKLAFWSALFFAVMPIHTEVVANIKSLDELLGMTFGILSCLYFIKYLEKKQAVQLGISSLLLLLGLFSKESTITYLGVIPVLVFMFYPKIANKKGLIAYAPLLIVTAVWLLIRHNVMASMQALDPEVFGQLNNPLSQLDSYGDQLASALNIQLMGLKKLFIPYPLLHDYSFDYLPAISMASAGGILLLLLFSALIGFTIRGVYQRKLWAFGLAFYGITISPVANVIFLNSTIFGERLMFTPSLGIVFTVVGLLMLQKKLPVKWYKLAYIPLAIFAVMSFVRQLDWKDNYTLFSTDVYHLTTSARANHNYATEVYFRYKTDRRNELKEEAAFYFTKATDIYPDYLDAWNNKGTLHLFAQEFGQAEEAFLKTIGIQPGYSKAYFNLAVAYQETQRYQLAADYYQLAIDKGQVTADAYYGQGYALGFTGRKEEARLAFENALQLNPNHAIAYLQIGKIYGEAGQTDTAKSYFQSCLQLQPSNLEANFYMGITYLNESNPTEGLKYLQKAQSISPGYNNVDQIIASITNTND